jgi:hypothetical protein
MTAPALPDDGRRPSVSEAFLWEPKGRDVHPSLKIHVTLVWTDATGNVPCAVYLKPARSAARHGSELHARCEETGTLISWLLRLGKKLDEMDEGLKPFSPMGGMPLALFAVRAAKRLHNGTASAAPVAP